MQRGHSVAEARPGVLSLASAARTDPGCSSPVLRCATALLLERIDSGQDVISPRPQSSDVGLKLNSGYRSQFYDGILRARDNAGPALVAPPMVYLGQSRDNRYGIPQATVKTDPATEAQILPYPYQSVSHSCIFPIAVKVLRPDR